MLKLKSIISVFLTLALLASFNPFTLSSEDELTEHFYPENMTDEEIEAVIQRITNGENVIFGKGIDYHGAGNSDEGDSDEWAGDDRNKTHQWLTAVALNMITNEFPSSSGVIANNFFKLTASEKATMIQYSDWPDVNEKKDVNGWHFYHAKTGLNLWQNGYDDHTAKTRFIYWYNLAVDKYKNHSRMDAYRDLSKALHYFQDLNAPPHTGDVADARFPFGYLSAGNQGRKHLAYEQEADSRKAEFRVTSGGLYSHHVSNSLSSVADTAANYSYGYYEFAYNAESPLYEASIRLPLQRSQRDTAGLIYRFFRDISDYDHSDYWCDEGIVYDDSKDVIAPG
ncbi:MAG: hypothetical protein FWH04_10230, partial [Oscillospiraceae bacterium]|nr:hypothetical protein [Oscillospiraceae bacterium]